MREENLNGKKEKLKKKPSLNQYLKQHKHRPQNNQSRGEPNGLGELELVAAAAQLF